MKHLLTRMSRRSAALAFVVLAAIGVGAALASIPAADGTITGCVNKADGTLRVIDLTKTRQCKTNTRDNSALEPDWVARPAGTARATGARGRQGRPRAKWTQGRQGRPRTQRDCRAEGRPRGRVELHTRHGS